jgi:hypothetical protein
MNRVKRSLANKLAYLLYLHPSRWNGADKDDRLSILVDNAFAPVALTVSACLIIVMIFLVKELWK